MDKLLEIKNLHARIGDKEILKGIDLTLNRGEIHAVMGPNGAGKSTLNAVLTGRPDYEVTEGSILYDGKDLLAMSPEERSWAGLFLSFQYPVEIPGVTITAFMKAAVQARRKAAGLPEMKTSEFLKLLKEKMAFVQMKPEFAKREVNVGFSGGEKKRNEIFQMAMLDPTLSILDDCRGRCQCAPLPGKIGHHHHALPETARIRASRRGPRPQGRSHRPHGRSRSDRGDRERGL